MSEKLRLSIVQSDARLADVAANARALVAAAPSDVDTLVVTPELSLSGYDLRDAAADVALAPSRVAELLATRGGMIVGFPERSPDGAVYNSVAHVDGGRVVALHRKVHLPTYGMFDEARVFAGGTDVVAYDWNGWRIGLLVCEDFWHPGLVYALCAQRIELLVATAAAPGRGVLAASDSARFASWDFWRTMATFYARVFGIYVVLANRVGVEEGVSFAGGSVAAAPDGSIIAAAPEAEEAVIDAMLQRSELARLRSPAWHGRDDRPLVVARALFRAEGLDADR